jgi:hypothetical protein
MTQGPHQVAKKSITMGLSLLDIATSSSCVVSFFTKPAAQVIFLLLSWLPRIRERLEANPLASPLACPWPRRAFVRYVRRETTAQPKGKGLGSTAILFKAPHLFMDATTAPFFPFQGYYFFKHAPLK